MNRIDVHCHVVPEAWRKWCMELGFDKPDGKPEIPVGRHHLPFTFYYHFDYMGQILAETATRRQETETRNSG
jgi:hypothetical protein